MKEEKQNLIIMYEQKTFFRGIQGKKLFSFIVYLILKTTFFFYRNIARYGQVEGRLCVERGDGSVWWQTMRNIREGVGHVDGG